MILIDYDYLGSIFFFFFSSNFYNKTSFFLAFSFSLFPLLIYYQISCRDIIYCCVRLIFFFFFFVNNRVNKWYMNELRLYLNESDHEDRMTKKDLKELKITTYTNVTTEIKELKITTYTNM